MPGPDPASTALTVEVVARPTDRAAVRGLGRWLAGIAPAAARGRMTIAVVSDARMRALNGRFRGLERPTDVLSFPAGRPAGRSRRSGPAELGEIAIARGVAARQARRAGHGVGVEFKVLALHGLLHLMGYDHERDRGQMARLERRLRRKAGLHGGLIERARAWSATRP
ncbi:MAG: rRNA maturation RNase YbeY [Vicinamibacterales bacterium]